MSTGRSAPTPVGVFEKYVQGVDGAAYKDHFGRIVIISDSMEKDGKVWRHVSVSRRSRVPTYEDLTYVKKCFIGDDKKAIMVLPEVENHVNIHPYCLHLYHCMGDDPLPEFSGVVAGKRTI